MFHFLMETFLAPLTKVYTFRNLFVLDEYVVMLVNSTTATNFLLLSYLNKVFDSINYVKFVYINFIIDIQSWL